MGVRAKMKCESIELSADGAGGSVRLSPVIGGSPENDKFYKYTPGGVLVLSTINQAAFEQFELGKEFYVDVTQVPPVEQAETDDECGELKPE